MELPVIEEKIKNLENGQEELKRDVKDLKDICTSVKLLAQETKALREDTNELKSNIKRIEQEPADKWKSLCGIITSIVVSAIITFVLCKIGLK